MRTHGYTDLKIRRSYYKTWKKLSGHAKSMLCRVYILMLGASKDSIPVDALICYFKKNKKNDDEQQDSDNKEEDFSSSEIAIKIAEDYDIPVINLAEKFYQKFEDELRKQNKTTVRDILEFLERSVDTRDYYVEEGNIDEEELQKEIVREIEIAIKEIKASEMANA